MITCKECGAQLPDTAKFCTGCGATLVDLDINKPVVADTKIHTSVDQPATPAAPEAPKAYSMPQTHGYFEPEHHSALTNMSEAAPEPVAPITYDAPATAQAVMEQPVPAPEPVFAPQQAPVPVAQPQETAPITGPTAAVAAGAAAVVGKQTAFQAATAKSTGKAPTAFEQATGSDRGSRVDPANPPIFPANQPRYGNGTIDK